MAVKETIFSKAPYLIQNSAIALFNTYQYRIRHGGKYKEFKNYYARADFLNESQLLREIESKRSNFFKYIKTHSKWYQSYDFSDLSLLPILEKTDIINNLNKIKTISEKDGLMSLTGGTTGASMRVVYTKKDMQERFAVLDYFRAKHGYELGKKTAWFSGKNLITENHLRKGICSHYDFINKINFYSTFHINQKNFEVYWNSLNKFQPEFIIGFPSSVYELCQIADNQGLSLQKKVKVFFPTAETVLPEHRKLIDKVMGCKTVDQYASSEGAPFILECVAGSLHIHPLTGIFEVVDKNLKPSLEGEMLVTSFTTHGTPLIRYRIGDSIKLAPSNVKCDCGSIFPLVERIDGRTTDYILSPTHGKVNLGNISNSTKNIEGIVKFQVLQSSLEEVKVLIVSNESFTQSQSQKFKAALQERFGPKILIELELVADIPKEKSGKFRLVKNTLSSQNV